MNHRPGQEPDITVTALSAGSGGLWTVTHDARDRSEAPSPEMTVTLTGRLAAGVRLNRAG